MGREVCAPWVSPADLCCEGDGTTTDCVEGEVALVYKWSDEDLALAASNILHARTGRRYPGVCEHEVWPCVDHCRPGCSWSCSRLCGPRGDRLVLPTSLEVLTAEVEIDGVVLDGSLYRIEGNTLVRIDGERWPRNNYGVTTDGGVELRVVFTAGAEPPIELRIAAADLACELKKSCNGQACSLDARVTSFARRGVAVELTDLSEMLKSGSTGIPSVDYALSVHEVRHGSATMHDPAACPRGLPVYPAPPQPS